MSAQASRDLSGTHPPSPVAGRRRAQLVAHGAKAAAEQRLSKSDVQALQNDPSPASRGALAAKFGRLYDQLVEGRTRALAEAVLQLLVKDNRAHGAVAFNFRTGEWYAIRARSVVLAAGDVNRISRNASGLSSRSRPKTRIRRWQRSLCRARRGRSGTRSNRSCTTAASNIRLRRLGQD